MKNVNCHSTVLRTIFKKKKKLNDALYTKHIEMVLVGIITLKHCLVRLFDINAVTWLVDTVI